VSHTSLLKHTRDKRVRVNRGSHQSIVHPPLFITQRVVGFPPHRILLQHDLNANLIQQLLASHIKCLLDQSSLPVRFPALGCRGPGVCKRSLLMTTLWVPSGVSTVPMTMNGSAVRLCLMICNIYTAEDVKNYLKYHAWSQIEVLACACKNGRNCRKKHM
jgi:hypothetical protein